MILVDANRQIYAFNADLPHHAGSRAWLEQQLGGSQTVGLPWVVFLAFLRICTSGRTFQQPLSIAQAIDYVDHWLALATARALAPGPHHWRF